MLTDATERIGAGDLRESFSDLPKYDVVDCLELLDTQKLEKAADECSSKH